ncbi:MAG: hypothetical protein QOE35_1610 [Actinomycetota bacterium]|jgi:hypothetical protein
MADSARPPDLVPGDTAQPSNQPIDEEVRSGVLHDEDDTPYVIEQSVVGAPNVKGGGEWPDPDAPPQAPAPGSDPAEAAAIAAARRRRGTGSDDQPLKDVLEADPERGGTATPEGEGTRA